MKLNLLPTTVSKGKQAKSSIVFSAIIAIAGVGGALYLAQQSSKDLSTAKDDNANSVQPAQDAYQRSTVADKIMADNVGLIRDVQLSKAMVAHNEVYPNLYDQVKKYIPAFYRINSLSATSAGGIAQVTLVGTIKTYQQYADLMMAFERIPHLMSVGRAGYQFDDEIVPNITPTDQVGKPHKPDQGPIPDDKIERLAYFQSQAQPEGYTGVGNFGTGTDNTRGAMPDYSLVTVTLTVPYNLTVPQPRTTLAASGSGGTAPAATTTTTTGTGGGIPPLPQGGGPGAGKRPPAPPQGGGGGTATKSSGGKGGNKAYQDALNGSGGD